MGLDTTPPRYRFRVTLRSKKEPLIGKYHSYDAINYAGLVQVLEQMKNLVHVKVIVENGDELFIHPDDVSTVQIEREKLC